MRAPIVLALALSACVDRAPRPGGPFAPITPIEVRVEEPAPEVEEAAPAAVLPTDPAPPELPATWSAPDIPALAFADALRRARSARDAYLRLAAPKDGGALEKKPWFTETSVLADRASRMYAAAYRARDASPEGRIEAISEAAELDLSLAHRLDELGLVAMPAEWRADPTMQVSFEDVASGPARRWRDEAQSLARRCVSLALEGHVTTAAATRCAALRTGKPSRRPGATACPCAPGDPLCSASIGSWCEP